MASYSPGLRRIRAPPARLCSLGTCLCPPGECSSSGHCASGSRRSQRDQGAATHGRGGTPATSGGPTRTNPPPDSDPEHISAKSADGVLRACASRESQRGQATPHQDHRLRWREPSRQGVCGLHRTAFCRLHEGLSYRRWPRSRLNVSHLGGGTPGVVGAVRDVLRDRDHAVNAPAQPLDDGDQALELDGSTEGDLPLAYLDRHL